MVHILLKPGLENFEHYFASVWDECNCVVLWAFFGIAFGIGMKTDLFQSWGHCWVFQICWHNERSTFTASPSRIWNSSTGIPSLPLALFVVMLSQVHLTSHSRMSGSRWVIIPSWLSWLWRSFLYSSSVYSCHLFLISSASVRSRPFLSFIELIFAWNVPLVSLVFLERSLIFPILSFPSISLHWSLRKAFLSLLVFLGTLHSEACIFSFLLCFLLLFFSQLFVRPPQIAILLFCISKERWLCGCRRAERSYSTFKVGRGSREEIPLLQGKEQPLRFAGAAGKRYPTSKVRKTQVRR